MERISATQAVKERKNMLARLVAASVPDVRLHQQAVEELTGRLADWWSYALPAVSPFSIVASPTVPTVIKADPVEELILRALTANESRAEFAVTPDGKVFTTDTGDWLPGSKAVFVAGLSPVLDVAADVFRHFTDHTSGRFRREGERFLADHAVHDGLGVFAIYDIGESGGGRGLWGRIVASILDWWNDDETAASRPAVDDVGSEFESEFESGESPLPDRGFQLVIDFDAGEWPASGVLKEMGYRVGKNGLTPNDRRQVLQRVLATELRAGGPEAQDYINQWGAPASAVRLRKMERCIAGFADGARRKTSADMSAAIADWDSDLEWLRTIYGR